MPGPLEQQQDDLTVEQLTALMRERLTAGEARALLASVLRDGKYRGMHEDWKTGLAKLGAWANVG